MQEGPSKKAKTSKGINTRTRGAKREDSTQTDNKKGTTSARGRKMPAKKQTKNVKQRKEKFRND